MAVVVTPARSTAWQADWRLYVSVLVSAAFVTVYQVAASSPLRWICFVLLPVCGWLWGRWARARLRRRARRAVGARLTRLPDDFVILYDVDVPAPWGRTRVDQVILSRFGVVVVTVGPPSGWVGSQIEAVRTLLFHQGFRQPAVPIAPLILLPPGSADVHYTHPGVPLVRVEHVRLEHLAPSKTAVLNQTQITTIAQILQQATFQSA